MKTILITFFVLVLSVVADPVLIMLETITAPGQIGARIIDPVKDKDDALAKIAYYESSTNFFKGLAYEAVLHECGHLSATPTTCTNITLKVVKAGVKTDLSKNVEMKSTEANPYGKQVATFILPVKDKADATAKESAVRASVTNKTFSVTEKLSAEVIK
jgi:hypothetical protein